MEKFNSTAEKNILNLYNCEVLLRNILKREKYRNLPTLQILRAVAIIVLYARERVTTMLQCGNGQFVLRIGHDYSAQPTLM